MRQFAIAVATALVFAMIAPAFAQPFADTPTNHWAYDAIAELAAKGLIEGYPDGTFKGDRAMTRYEMAMVVARLLARIESIQIPTPAPAMKPEIGRADLDTILRLVNEFRAELAAKNVRLTAVEEELNALKAQQDNVKIRGRFRWRYDGGPSAGGAPIAGNGNANTGSTGAGSFATIFRSREGLKLSVDGSVAADVHAILGLELASNVSSTPLTFNSSNFGTGNFNGNGTTTTSPQYVLANIVELFFDWKNIWGTPIELWIGRFGGGVQGFASYPVQFGPFGLLLKTNDNTWGASTNNSGVNLADGLRLAGHWPEYMDLQVQGTVIRVGGPTGGGTYNQGEDMYGVDANVQIMPGLRFGGYYVGNSIGATTVSQSTVSAKYHGYGNPDTPSQNPVTTNCPALATGAVSVTGQLVVQGGIQCPAAGSGWGAYVGWDAYPGIHLDLELAQWNDQVLVGNDSAYGLNVTWDIAAMTGVGAGHNLSVQTGYEFAGTNFYPPYGQSFDTNINGDISPGNFQGFVGVLSYDLFPELNLLFQYITGNYVSNGQNATEWQIGVIWKMAPSTSLWVRYETESVASIAQYYLYRAEMNYTF